MHGEKRKQGMESKILKVRQYKIVPDSNTVRIIIITQAQPTYSPTQPTQ